MTQQRAALHELMVQVVTERRIPIDPEHPYSNGSFSRLVAEARANPEFQALASSGEFSREQISGILDRMGMERIPEVPPSEHITMMVTGGPATGKTALVRALAQANPEVYSNAVIINPDFYKEVLALPSQHGSDYLEFGHEEGSLLTRSIVDRLGEKMEAGSAPHVLFDMVAPSAPRLKFAMQSSHLVVVTGTAPCRGYCAACL